MDFLSFVGLLNILQVISIGFVDSRQLECSFTSGINRIAHENDAGRYYECAEIGYYVEKECSNGLTFDESTLVK